MRFTFFYYFLLLYFYINKFFLNSIRTTSQKKTKKNLASEKKPMTSIAKPINEVLKQHKVEWKEYCKKVRDKGLRLKWLQMKRSEYLIHDDTVCIYESRTSFLGTGDLTTRPNIVFIGKSPRSKDRFNGFSCETWTPLIDRIRTGKELKTFDGLRCRYFCLYYFPRRLFIKKYKPVRRGENDNEEKKEEEDFAPELTPKHIDVYGWYVIQILKLLDPRIVVPIGSYISRATLQRFQSSSKIDLMTMKDVFGSEEKIQDLWLTKKEKEKYHDKRNIPYVSVIPLIDACQTSLVSFCDGDKDEVWESCWTTIGKTVVDRNSKRSRKDSESILRQASVDEMQSMKKAKLIEQRSTCGYIFGSPDPIKEDLKPPSIHGPMDSFLMMMKKKSAEDFVF